MKLRSGTVKKIITNPTNTQSDHDNLNLKGAAPLPIQNNDLSNVAMRQIIRNMVSNTSENMGTTPKEIRKSIGSSRGFVRKNNERQSQDITQVPNKTFKPIDNRLSQDHKD